MDVKYVFYSHLFLSFVDLQHLRIQTTISLGTSDELESLSANFSEKSQTADTILLKKLNL